MNSLSLFYAIPAGVFLFVAGLFFIHRHLPRWMALLPVLACYSFAAFIMMMGGFHNVAHVALEGVEVDLVDDEGQARQIVVGGEAEAGKPSGIEIPGYPVDALRLSLQQDGSLMLRPGSGYERGVLVRSGDQIVPVEPGSLPRLVSLQSGDSIQIEESAGGDVLAQWKLGTGKYDLNLDRTNYRWIGGANKGVAHMEGMPDQVIGVRAEGSVLFIKKGAGFTAQLGVMINGRRLDFGKVDELRTVYQPDVTTLALVSTDPAVGRVKLLETGFQRFNAELQWDSILKDKPLAHPIELETSRVYKVGGSTEDDFVVKGLPPGALRLVIGTDGKMNLDLTENGKKAKAKRELVGTYPQSNAEFNQGVRVGNEGDAVGGVFILIGKGQQTQKPASEDSESAPEAPVSVWNCAWLPNASTRWILPNREIVLPLMNVDVKLGSRRPWTALHARLWSAARCLSLQWGESTPT